MLSPSHPKLEVRIESSKKRTRKLALPYVWLGVGQPQDVETSGLSELGPTTFWAQWRNPQSSTYISCYYTWRGGAFRLRPENGSVCGRSPPFPCMQAMNGRNQSIVTGELVEFEKWTFEAQDFRENCGSLVEDCRAYT